MIILDTNVLSEPMKSVAETEVLDWLATKPDGDLFITSINLAELLTGASILDAGRRRETVFDAIAKVESKFSGRILPFDQSAAHRYADLRARSRRAGFSVSLADAQIAAIALANNARLATRDIAPFAFAGVPVINPWADR